MTEQGLRLPDLAAGRGRAEQRRELLDHVAGHFARPAHDEPMMVLPSRTNPRFVLPAHRRTAMHALLAHNRLREPSTQVQRAAVAAAIALGLVSANGVPPVDRRRDDRDESRPPLIDVLADLLGVPDLTFAIGLSRFGSFAKPVLQLFDPDGGSVGYAKVGWTPVTAELVRTEAVVLRHIEAAPPRGFSVPRLLVEASFEDQPVIVTETLPLGSRRVAPVDFPPVSCIWEIAMLGGPVSIRPVEEVPAVRRALTDVGAVEAREAAQRVVDHHRGVRVPVGFAHGDLVTWNMAVDGSDLWIWDWEYGLRDVPVGLDIVHGIYQQLVEIDRRPLRTALLRAAQLADGKLARLGLDTAQRSAVIELHRLELLDRQSRVGHASDDVFVRALARTISQVAVP